MNSIGFMYLVVRIFLSEGLFFRLVLSGEWWINSWVNVYLQIVGGTQSGKVVRERHILPLLPFIPELIAQVENSWRFRLLQV